MAIHDTKISSLRERYLETQKKVSGVPKQKLVRAGAFYGICQGQAIEACVMLASDSSHTLISVSAKQDTENVQI